MVEAFAEDMPDLAGLAFVEAWTGGDGAAALYRGEGDGEGQVLFVYVKVLNEGGDYRFDGLMDIDDVAVQPDGAPTRFDLDALSPELRL